MQNQLLHTEKQLTTVQSSADTLREELSVARDDIKRYSGMASEQQQLYQRELVQHGHTMEELEKGREREREKEEEIGHTRQELAEMRSELEMVKVCVRVRVKQRSKFKCACMCMYLYRNGSLTERFFFFSFPGLLL